MTPIGPLRRNEPELTRLLHQRVVFASSLHRKQVKLTKLVAVGIAFPFTWVGCRPHSRPHATTVLEALLRCHGLVLLCCCDACNKNEGCVDFYGVWYIRLRK
jgi:hypothetical protein